MNRLLPTLIALLLVACGSGSTEGPAPAHAEGEAAERDEDAQPEPTRTLADGTRLFGEELSEIAETSLADIVSEPSRFDGQSVKTAGEITSVCQSAGCWMEIRVDADSPGIRVPMAGHNFFLPRDVVGSRATIEGQVIVAELSAEDREHLESEGAQAGGSEISIEATGVLVHP